MIFRLPCRVHELEERLAASEAGRAELEQQLALSRSQLADARALMDSAQVRHSMHFAGPTLCTSWPATAAGNQSKPAAVVVEHKPGTCSSGDGSGDWPVVAPCSRCSSRIACACARQARGCLQPHWANACRNLSADPTFHWHPLAPHRATCMRSCSSGGRLWTRRKRGWHSR